MDLVAQPRFADALMERLTDVYIRLYQNFLTQVGPYLSVVAYWDDVTMQTGPMISPELYRRYVKPKQRRLVEAIRKETSAKIFLHCCGAAVAFIPDFIDIGFDILNPVQVSAAGMDTARLKQEFGKDIVFWGGIDTQHVLPFGTPQQVRDEVHRRIEDLGRDGGYVCAAVHNIQAGTPPENLDAMFRAIDEYRRYR